jgi:hypothetical protein
MRQVTLAQLIPVLQTAIGPLVMISAVGLLVLTMTNRIGRAIDRARILAAQLPNADPAGRSAIQGQLRILWNRAHWLRAAITLAALNALSAAVLVILLFFTALWQLETAWLISGLFVFGMACQIGSLIAFLNDINKSLLALRIELLTAGLDEPASEGD